MRFLQFTRMLNQSTQQTNAHCCEKYEKRSFKRSCRRSFFVVSSRLMLSIRLTCTIRWNEMKWNNEFFARHSFLLKIVHDDIANDNHSKLSVSRTTKFIIVYRCWHVRMSHAFWLIALASWFQYSHLGESKVAKRNSMAFWIWKIYILILCF